MKCDECGKPVTAERNAVRRYSGGGLPHVELHGSGVARQPRQCRRPLSLVARLPCSEVDSHGAELRGARRLWRASVDVSTPGDLEVDEPGRDDRCL